MDNKLSDGIDIVIPWVDGSQPEHHDKRMKYVTEYLEHSDSTEKSTAEHTHILRWDDYNEIYICLWSIHNFANWVRKIWIVTDAQTPDLSSFPNEFREKINIIDHREIFSGFENVLPTFNSATIGTASWKIRGLSEKYVMFNDDIFFVGPVQASDFVRDEKIVLRGNFRKKIPKGTLWENHMENSAVLSGNDSGSLFRLAHICHTLDKKILEEFFLNNLDVFEQNVRHRFRHPSQFNITSLGVNLLIKSGQYHLSDKVDWHHIPAGLSETRAPQRIRRELVKLREERIKIACVNNLRASAQKLPRSFEILESIIRFPKIVEKDRD